MSAAEHPFEIPFEFVCFVAFPTQYFDSTIIKPNEIARDQTTQQADWQYEWRQKIKDRKEY